MIVCPIAFVDRDGCIALLDSVDEAIANVDPYDVRDGEYVVYDSEGRLLQLLLASDGGSVAQLVEEGPLPSHERELRRALVHVLGPRALPDLDAASTQELLATALRRRRGHYVS